MAVALYLGTAKDREVKQMTQFATTYNLKGFGQNKSSGARERASIPSRILGHLSRTMTYQGRRSLHQALNY